VKIVVYTAIFGVIDPLWSPFPAALDVEHVCFTDRARTNRGLWTHQLTEDWPEMLDGSGGMRPLRQAWDVRVIKPRFGHRKQARHCKTMVHEYLPDADVTVWLDGNVRLMVPVKWAVRRWLGEADFATFDHPDRRCLYEEAAFCIRRGKGNKGRLQAQVAAYRDAGMPTRWSLPETKCVIRRNTPEMAELNEAWWAEIRQRSLRDQVSLPYVCWKLGLKWKPIPGRAGLESYPGKKNKAFWYTKHRKAKQ
jgi:hypothetical protein